MKLSKLIKHTAIAATLALSVGLSQLVDAKTLRWAYQGDMASLDPMSLNETFTLGFQGWLYETLAAYVTDMKLVPQLAERWKNHDATNQRFHLRRGAKFLDGRKDGRWEVRV